MAPRYKYVIFILIFLIASAERLPHLHSSNNEISHYNKIVQMIKDGDSAAGDEIKKFSEKYPGSRRKAALLFLYADLPVNVNESIKRHRAVIKTGDRNFTELSYRRICQIYYLQSSWDRLKVEAESGANLGGPRQADFIKFLISASVETGDYDRAEDLSYRLMSQNREFQRLASTLNTLSFIKKIQTGYSRDYIYRLRETATGFSESDIFQTTLFLLGDFHEKTGSPERAYSAYVDLITHFPGSPEAELARSRLYEFKEKNLSRKGYIPKKEQVQARDPIDISPDSPVDESAGSEYYSLSIGPFDSSRESDRVAKMLDGFSLKRIKTENGYLLFAGRFESRENAYRLRIRVAEEYGINGHIVMIAEKNGRIFVYGD